ncbi:30S ribosomal protein S2 [Candidatus Uhrbacteria bacterium]|nr:30S ribosomal protein S2 [Candidatus Uhrbacteria bacterium]
MAIIPSLEEMLQAGVHFGHRVSRWHPNMRPYIFGKRNGVHVIDLEKTTACLEKALKVLTGVVERGGTVLFLGTKPQLAPYIKAAAEKCGAPYVNGRWLGGTLTNFSEIYKLIKRLRDLKRRKEVGDLRKYTKREQLEFDREIEDLEGKIGGIAMLDDIPSVVVVFDMRNEMTAVHEANRKGVPIVAVCDTNVNPQLVSYPIPANDDAVKSIALMTNVIADAILEGKKDVKEIKKAPVRRKVAIK